MRFRKKVALKSKFFTRLQILSEKKMNQSPSEVIMVRPVSFGFNAETSEDNPFMNNDVNNDKNDFDVNLKAQKEFDNAVDRLR